VSPSLADVDLHALSDRARQTLTDLAQPLAAGESLDELVDALEITRRDASLLLEQLAAEWTNLSGGAGLPKLTPIEYEALRDSIAEYGQLVPALVDAAGKLIDGHNRKRACNELGKLLEARQLEWVTTDEQRNTLALVLNVARRHLPASARRGIALAELMRNPQRSDRATAIASGVSHTLVQQLRRELEQTGELATVASRFGADGVERRLPAKRQQSAGKTPAQRPLLTCPQCGHAFDPMEGR